ELEKLLRDDRETYEKFFQTFGRQLKFGVYSEFGSHKEDLQDLLLFYSSHEKKLVTLAEYVGRMKSEQQYIYYAAGESVARIEKMPQTELLQEKGFEILYFSEDIDEFAIKMLAAYQDKEFKSISNADLGIEDETPATAEPAAEQKLFDFMQDVLSEQVSSVRASKRLKNHPVCLANAGEVSIEMEKILNAMPNNQNIKADKVLEINTNHEVFKSLQEAYEQDQDKLKLYTNLLFNQALLIEGINIEDPVEFTNNICSLMK
ncbi:MAG TPA: molecular chaperone HtpG, partial [Oscillospiraceae bacterium]|nr:molecular chaperone HtpG [Oscillospiraceae bacterium]